MVEVVVRTLAVLALVAVAIAVSSGALLVTRRVPGWLRDDVALPLAAAVAWVATLGSLYLSEVAEFVPCTLCWYQRIAMYPFTIVLTVAALQRDHRVWRTVTPIAIIGGLVSGWHIAIERNPALSGACDPAAPCALKWVEEFGFLTLPTMALIGFVTIAVLTLVARRPHPSRDLEQS